MTVGVLIGRFQPFTPKHKMLVERILDENDSCLILIRTGRHSDENPYGFKERKKMIESKVKKEGLVEIMELPDYWYKMRLYFDMDIPHYPIHFEGE